jgi:hypothetical protein
MNLYNIYANLKLNVFIQTTKRIEFHYTYPKLGFVLTILLAIFYDIIHRIHISKLLNSKRIFGIQGISWFENKEFSIKFDLILNNLNTPNQIKELLETNLEINDLGLVKFNKLKIVIEFPSENSLRIETLFLSPIYNLINNLFK